MQHVSVVKKWGLADSAACECGEEVGTGRQCSTVQHVSVAPTEATVTCCSVEVPTSSPHSHAALWGLADSAACECGEDAAVW